MKKFLSLILAAVMILSLVTACGTKPVEPATSDEPTELRFMFIGGGDVSAKEKLYTEIVEEFNATNTYNCKIVIETCDDPTYKTKIPTLMTQNDMADIFWTWDRGFLQPYVEAGKVYCLDDALAADEEWASRFGGSIMDGVTFNGKVYGAPHTNIVYPVYYNKTIFQQCGVTVPQTWDEFIAMCNTLNEKGVTPFAMGGQDAWVMGQFLLRLVCGVGGVELYDKIRYATGTWEDEGFIEAGELLQELIDMNIFEENFAGVSNDEAMSMFVNGETAMWHMGNWVTAGVIEKLGEENVGVFYMPNYNPNVGNANLSAVDDNICIAETCKNKEAAVAFLKMFSEPYWQEKAFLEVGLFPATNVELDPAKVDAVSIELMSITGEIDPIGPFDILLGANMGNEFNNVSVAIATGKDPAEQFAALQAFAEFEAE